MEIIGIFAFWQCLDNMLLTVELYIRSLVTALYNFYAASVVAKASLRKA